MHIKYFWTWAALNPNVDTTHFVIEQWKKKLYVDAWNGIGLAQRVLRGEVFVRRSYSG
jgi:hypothetical protein